MTPLIGAIMLAGSGLLLIVLLPRASNAKPLSHIPFLRAGAPTVIVTGIALGATMALSFFGW